MAADAEDLWQRDLIGDSETNVSPFCSSFRRFVRQSIAKLLIVGVNMGEGTEKDTLVISQWAFRFSVISKCLIYMSDLRHR